MVRSTLGLLGALAVLATAAPAPDRVAINDNRAAAGTLRNGVLTVRLEARAGEWRPDSERDRGLLAHAFAEAGRAASVPGPLLRVPAGTEIRALVANTLGDTLYVHGLSERGVAPTAAPVTLAPGEVRELRFAAGAPGTYFYWGATRAVRMEQREGRDSQLGGAFVVDPPGTTGRGRDRVLVMTLWRQGRPTGIVSRGDVLRFAINGKAWPHTERLTYTEGDSVRFRVVNLSAAVHPMHLHGFYFDVTARGDAERDVTLGGVEPPHRVVTERLVPGRTFAMAWLPDRSGHWLFHCHDNLHVLRNAPLDGSRLPAEHAVHARNHALEMMGGLVMGIEVRPRRAVVASAVSEPPARRMLRLVARVDSGGTVDEPAYAYALRDGARPVPNAGALPAPTIVLRRGEPVSITVVNALPEPTAVHWHGIELDSYYDGVADFSGHPGRLAPAIVPGDSFVARFTPPRAGTFMYHPHADEVRQQQAGLAGAIVVVDDPAEYDPARDVLVLITVPRRGADSARVLLDGSLAPAAREMRVGERHRVRVVNLHTYRPSMIARLTRDTATLRWRALAKDGMTLPPSRATVGPAAQQLGNGEAYDFEFTPDAPGDLRLTVTTAGGVPLASMPIRVR